MRNDGADRNGGEKRKWMDGRRTEREKRRNKKMKKERRGERYRERKKEMFE